MEFISSLFTYLLLGGAALGLVVLMSYNKLQRLAQGVKEGSSNVKVAISRKLSMVNQLMDVARNYTEAEQLTHLQISKDAAPEGLMNAYQQSGVMLASLQGLAQRFPELKANEQFNRLSDGIRDCENDIQKKRTDYNTSVKAYNSQCLTIPTVFVARALGFTSAPYLEFDQSGVIEATELKEFKTDDGERLGKLIGAAGTGVLNAGKSIAGHAGTAGRLIAEQATATGKVVSERLQEVTAASSTGSASKAQTPNTLTVAEPQFFYRVPPDGVPCGPVSMATIHGLQSSGQLPENVAVAQAGTNEWKSLAAQ